MDYVIYGTGYGATLMLLGYALRTWGPGWRFRDHDEGVYDRNEFRTARDGWTRFMQGLGAVLATCGAALAVFTILIMVINPGDTAGVMVALIVSAAILIAVAAWAWFYLSRYGSWGVLSAPQALSNYASIRYDSGSRVSPLSEPDDAEDEYEDEQNIGDDADEDAYHPDEEYEDDGELAARYSKYEVHHPEEHQDEVAEAAEIGEVGAEVHRDVVAEVATPDEDAETVYELAADESGSEEGHGEAPVAGGVEGEPEDPEIVDGEVASDDDVETLEIAPDEDDDIVIETPVEATAAGEDETLAVVPDAHEDAVQDDLPDVGTSDDPVTGGGREEALRRLRERREQRRSEQDVES